MVAQEVLDSLLRLLGREQVSTVEEELEFYSGDALTPLRAFRAAPVLSRRADVVVRPQSQEQVVELVRLAAQHRVPMVPYGGGTGVMGAVVPVKGGIVFDLKGMNRIVDISEEDRIAVVEAGVVLRDLEEALNRRGLMLGHDPWSLPIATVGGAIATNGVGYRASLYGSMGEQVLGLEVALPNGRVLRTRALPLYSAGPNLNHLFIGTEGVFGIITQAALRVFRLPEQRSFATFVFDGFEAGFAAVSELFALGLVPAVVDLTEESPGETLLYLVLEGYREGVEAQERRTRQVALSHGGRDIGPDETLRYWEERYDIAERYKAEVVNAAARRRRHRRGAFDYLHVALPLSRVLEYRRRCRELLAQRNLEVREYAVWTRPELFSAAIFSTAMGGNAAGLGEAVDELLTLAQDMGGAMEYCHGVGVKLGHLLARELGVGQEVVGALKRALDPHDLMNPGKLGL